MMTAAAVDRSLNGKHTFSCALSTRGAVCDCWPEQAGRTWSTEANIAATTDSVERCAMCGRPVGSSSNAIVDVDGIVQLCGRCFLQAENAQYADAMHGVDL